MEQKYFIYILGSSSFISNTQLNVWISHWQNEIRTVMDSSPGSMKTVTCACVYGAQQITEALQ